MSKTGSTSSRSTETVVALDKELTPPHAGPLSHDEVMAIARAVMDKNKNALAALAK